MLMHFTRMDAQITKDFSSQFSEQAPEGEKA